MMVLEWRSDVIVIYKIIDFFLFNKEQYNLQIRSKAKAATDLIMINLIITTVLT